MTRYRRPPAAGGSSGIPPSRRGATARPAGVTRRWFLAGSGSFLGALAYGLFRPQMVAGGRRDAEAAEGAASLESPGTRPPPAPQQEESPARAGPRDGSRRLPPVHLTIPSIGVDSPVVPVGVKYDGQGQLFWETASFAVGYHTNTALPGAPGNCVLSGHISSRNAGAVFKKLPDIALGAGAVVATAESLFLYQVVETQVVDPYRVEVMERGEERKLTLITCVPDGIYSHRLIVTALPV